jgi:cyclohexa-1,5-dienecarbonyl-CoA hydratase
LSILTEKREGILYVDFNAPPVNILGSGLIGEIIEVLDTERESHVVALKGSGKIFCAGLDVKDHLPEKVEEMIRLFADLILKIIEFPGIVASIVQGGALGGGCEVAFCSDLVLAAKGIEFSQPEIKIGVFPPAACALYPLLFPSKTVNHMMYSGQGVQAETLENLGIVNRTFASDTLFEDAHEFLSKYTRLSLAALRSTKKASQVPISRMKESLAEVNRIYLEELMNTEDALEGLNSFLEKRRPVWKNK